MEVPSSSGDAVFRTHHKLHVDWFRKASAVVHPAERYGSVAFKRYKSCSEGCDSVQRLQSPAYCGRFIRVQKEGSAPNGISSAPVHTFCTGTPPTNIQPSHLQLFPPMHLSPAHLSPTHLPPMHLPPMH